MARTSTATAYDADHETQGRIREWKRRLATGSNHIELAMISHHCREAVSALAFKTSLSGRSRAFAKLHKRLSPHATLQAVELGMRPYFALWRAIKPRGGVTDDRLGCVTLITFWLEARNPILLRVAGHLKFPITC